MMENDAFSSVEEIKRDLQVADGRHGSGPFVYMDWETGEPYISNSESHAILLGVTGCGKTRRGTIPMVMSMIQAKESFLSLDPKGDIYNYTYTLAKERGYHTKVFDFRDLTKGDGFDIFGYAYEKYKSEDPSEKQLAIDLIKSIGDSIYGEDTKISDRRDPFWDSSAKTFFMALMYILFEYGTAEQAHPASLIQVAHECFTRIGPTRIIEKACELFPDAPFVPLLSNVRSAPSDTLGSIKSSFFQPLNVFLMSESVRNMMSDASFNMNDLDGKKKVAIYIILPDENTNYSALAAIILTQIVSHHIRIAHTKYDGSLPRRLNVVIEELGNIGASLPMLPSLMTAGRSRNIRTFCVLQSFSQLDTLYGASKAATILSNADTLIAYRTSELDTLILLSKKCGVVYDEEHDVMVPLISPTQLASFDTGEILVLKSGRLKYTTQLPDFTEIISCKRIPAPDHVPSRGQVKTNKLSFENVIKRKMHEEMLKREKEYEKKAQSDESPIIPDSPLPFFMRDPDNPFSLSEARKAVVKPATYVKSKVEAEEKLEAKIVAEYNEIRKALGQMLGKAIGMAADKKKAEDKKHFDAVCRKIEAYSAERGEKVNYYKYFTTKKPHAKKSAENKTVAEPTATKPVKSPSEKKSSTRKAAAKKTEETAEKKPSTRKTTAKKAVEKPAEKKPSTKAPAASEAPSGKSEKPAEKYSVIINIHIGDSVNITELLNLCSRYSDEEPDFHLLSDIEVYFSSFEEAAAFSDIVHKTLGLSDMTIRHYRS